MLLRFAVRNFLYISVADLEIEKGGFSHWRAKRAGHFLGCHAHFRSRERIHTIIAGRLNRGVRHKRNLVHCPTVLF